MYPRSVRAAWTDALFASPLQRSDELSMSQIRRAIGAALDAYGDAGCAGRVAQEFGDHPETAAVRMRWACAMVTGLDGHVAGLDTQPVSRMRCLSRSSAQVLAPRDIAV